ncbi:hypothetical protein C7456_104161 [Fulvimonas soli]|uniref:DUF3047 family protein n=2 Tax=Fulvimonas soli TaxID=155197 RepID=A0A316I8J7_9GAMM|nr:hypothetical protein C7456_104161 [Fulvimonas soli]
MPMHRLLRPAMASLLALSPVPAPAAGPSLDFSGAAPGTNLPAGWTRYAMSRHKPPAAVTVEAMDGRSVVHIAADRGAGAIAHRFDAPAQSTLRWRWKIDRTVAKGDLGKKAGDDFAARVYVFFDVPRSQLTFGQRMKLALARDFTGQDLPGAALCYVWDNRHPVGTVAPNPFYAPVRTIVVESGDARAGQWQAETRDLAADFRKAFGTPAPRITGIAIAADTDNTRSQANAWFADLALEPAATP